MEFTFEEIKVMLNKLIQADMEPELSLVIGEKTYMIIGYEDRYSFQRCGYHDGSGEIEFKTLDELYNTETIDGILLSRDWNSIIDYDCFEFQWLENGYLDQ